jgi:hypothetical protein
VLGRAARECHSRHRSHAHTDLGNTRACLATMTDIIYRRPARLFAWSSVDVHGATFGRGFWSMNSRAAVDRRDGYRIPRPEGEATVRSG